MAAPAGTVPHRRRSTLRRATSLERGQLAVLLTIIIATAAAWLLTLERSRTMDVPMGVVARSAADGAAGGMDGMAAGGASAVAASGMAAAGWSFGGFVTFVVAWAVMMAAMMFPAAAPMLLLFRRVSAQRKAQGSAFVPTWIFAAGYLVFWTTVGVLVWALVGLGSELAGRLSATERATWAPLALGAVLVAAGLYQLTPLKRVCLDHCRTPLGFVMTHWRDGRPGALRMGVIHGMYCLGCCWALFAVLVAAGVMSLAWMLLLTLVIFAEKALPIGNRGPQAIGAAFLALGIFVAIGAPALP